MTGAQIRATLSGGEAELGLIRAADVARLLLGLETAMAASAYAALRTPRRTGTGRHIAPVESASRLVFRAVEAGSVSAVLELPDLTGGVPDVLEIDVHDLAEAALDQLMSTPVAPQQRVDHGIARALADLADQLDIGSRYDTLAIHGGGEQRVLRIDAEARAYYRTVAEAPLAYRQQDVVAGTLREADFDRRTARLRTPVGDVVVVRFAPELEAGVQEALRQPARFQGEVLYDPATSTIRRVDLRAITAPEPLSFPADDFWDPSSVEELLRAQQIGPASFDQPLFDATDDERREIAEALAELGG